MNRTEDQVEMGEFGQEMLNLFQSKRKDIMEREMVTEFEPEEWEEKGRKYGDNVIFEYKGVYKLGDTPEKQTKAEPLTPSSKSSQIHPRLLKKELQNGNASVMVQSRERSPPPQKKQVQFAAETPKARGQRIRIETTPNHHLDLETQAYLQDISNNFQVDENSMKALLGEGLDDSQLEQFDPKFKTPLNDKSKRDSSSNSALRRLSQSLKSKVDKTKRRSSLLLDTTTKRLSLSTPKFMKRSKTTKHEKEGEKESIDASEFERALSHLEHVYGHVEREVLRKLLLKANGNVDRAMELYSKEIQF